MSIFSAIGSAFKAVGKVGLGVVKTAANVAGTQIGVGQVFNTNTNGGIVQAMPQSVIPNPTMVTINGGAITAATPSLIDLSKYALGSLGDFLSGRSHVQVDANVGAGGRIADIPGTGSSFPSWLLPVSLGGLALLLFLPKGGRKRY